MDSFLDNSPALLVDSFMPPAHLGTEFSLDGTTSRRKDDHSLPAPPPDLLPCESMSDYNIPVGDLEPGVQLDLFPKVDPSAKDAIKCPSPTRSPSRQQYSYLFDVDWSHLGGKPTLLSPLAPTPSRAAPPLSPRATRPPVTSSHGSVHHDIQRPLSPKISTLGWPSAFAENIFQHVGRDQTGTPQTAMLFYDDIRVLESDVSIDILVDGDPDAEFWASLAEPIDRPPEPLMRIQTPSIKPPAVREPTPVPEFVVRNSTPFVRRFKDKEGDFLELIHEYSRWAELPDTLPASRWEVPATDLPLIVVH